MSDLKSNEAVSKIDIEEQDAKHSSEKINEKMIPQSKFIVRYKRIAYTGEEYEEKDFTAEDILTVKAHYSKHHPYFYPKTDTV